jgi:hypothetical protein
MVTVVTIKMGQGAVSKTPSPSSQPSQCLSSPQKNPQILRRPDGECVEDREPFMLRICKVGTICKPQQRLRRSRILRTPSESPRYFAAAG